MLQKYSKGDLGTVPPKLSLSYSGFIGETAVVYPQLPLALVNKPDMVVGSVHPPVWVGLSQTVSLPSLYCKSLLQTVVGLVMENSYTTKTYTCAIVLDSVCSLYRN